IHAHDLCTPSKGRAAAAAVQTGKAGATSTRADLLAIRPEFNREGRSVEARLLFLVLAVVGDDHAMRLQRIAQRDHHRVRTAWRLRPRIHLDAAVVVGGRPPEKVVWGAVDELPCRVRQAIAWMAGLRRRGERPEPRRVAADQRPHRVVGLRVLEDWRDQRNSLVISLSSSVSAEAQTTSATRETFDAAAGRMNGCALASLVPNSRNRQWVVLPPASPVFVLFGTGL